MRSAGLLLAACLCAAAGERPSRVLLTWDGDPATTQTVSWRTETPVPAPQGQIAPFTSSPRVEGLTFKGAIKEPGRYGVRFENLKPGTRYTYRVGDGAAWSEWHVFGTAAARPEPFRFIYLGDAQDDLLSLWPRALRAAWAAAPDARFIVHAGDLVSKGYDDRLWGEWCEAMGFIGAAVPSLPVPGNHDSQRAPEGGVSAARLWNLHFALPSNGPPDSQGRSYYIDYQGVRMIALEAPARHIEWLEGVLRDNPNRWTVVVQHQPVYPISKGRTAPLMQEALAPVYDKYGVDLVLQGHDHAYGRTYKLRGGRAGATGTVYAVSVSGTEMYRLTPPDPALFAKTLAGAQMYQVVSAAPDRLLYQAFTIDGAPIDSFEVRKP